MLQATVAPADPRAFAGLLLHDVVRMCVLGQLDFDDAAHEGFALAKVLLDDRRARALAENDHDVRENRGRFAGRLRPGEHDRVVELHAGRHVDERAAVTERRRERGETVAAPVDHAGAHVLHERGVTPQGFAQRHNDDAWIGAARFRREVGAADVDERAGERRRAAIVVGGGGRRGNAALGRPAQALERQRIVVVAPALR
jgi:hypothetical protein